MAIDNKKNESEKHDINFTEESSEEKPKFVSKKYPRLWEIELTDEQRENLKKKIKEDEKWYKKLGKNLVKDKNGTKLFRKVKDE
ncbi:MAG: hypothetical protein K2P53_02880 [Rickettsiales bacterium]|jgi:hypothetical protein|nr:hypothetical protein [Rickettsiales bacterium]